MKLNRNRTLTSLITILNDKYTSFYLLTLACFLLHVIFLFHFKLSTNISSLFYNYKYTSFYPLNFSLFYITSYFCFTDTPMIFFSTNLVYTLWQHFWDTQYKLFIIFFAYNQKEEKFHIWSVGYQKFLKKFLENIQKLRFGFDIY